jgi:Ca2+-transporting ATPase
MPTDPAVRDWHAMAAAAAVAELNSSARGLTSDEAAARLRQVGENRLQAVAARSALSLLAAQFRSIVVLLLVAAVAVSLAFGDTVEAAAIAAVLALNTILGFLTELRARRAIDALRDLDVPRAVVVRDGAAIVVDAYAIVPGDLIELEAGRQVPADARVISAVELQADEAPLSGESLPVLKDPDAELTPDTPLADRVTMVYKGTVIVAGHGRAVVSATGMNTEVGRIGRLVGSVEADRTPLEQRLDALGRRLVWVTLAIVAVVAILDLARGLPLNLVIETAIALAIAAVPEALPAVATVALAIGMHRMARRHALVRSLPAVESLGSTTVVCTDKTRTLTTGEMSVRRAWTAGRDIAIDTGATGDAELRTLLEAAVLASYLREGSSDRTDPLDAALLAAASRAGIDADRLLASRPRVGFVPFTSERKRLVTFHETDGVLTAYVKGAPRAILDVAGRALTDSGERSIDDQLRGELLGVNDQLARAGLRVIAVAEGPVPAPEESALRDLLFVGFVGLADPPAPGVKETIARLRAAGLRTLMLTGDQRLTAEAVGRDLGLLDADDKAIDGRELEGRSPGEARDLVVRYHAFTRISPEHKLTVVRALQDSGEIVAMFGDGVNDAAALKQADVGVAMGRRGTDVAKQAASIVLLDDRFETIAAAVEQGRVIFDNIRRFVFYLFSCNVAEILVLLIAGLAALPLPLLPLHLLWLNLLTDTFPALSLAMEPGAADLMRRPPRRPDDAILSRPFVMAVFGYASLITAATLAMFVWALSAAPERAQTMAFCTLAFAQVAHLGTARSDVSLLSWRGALANPYAVAGAAIAVALQVGAVSWPPLASVLRLESLSPSEWLLVAGVAIVPALVGEALKRFRRLDGFSQRAAD